MLLDARLSRGLDRAARLHYASADQADHLLATGMLIDSGVARVLGNFFMSVYKPAFPFGLFTADIEALRWLKSWA